MIISTITCKIMQVPSRSTVPFSGFSGEREAPVEDTTGVKQQATSCDHPELGEAYQTQCMQNKYVGIKPSCQNMVNMGIRVKNTNPILR